MSNVIDLTDVLKRAKQEQQLEKAMVKRVEKIAQELASVLDEHGSDNTEAGLALAEIVALYFSGLDDVDDELISGWFEYTRDILALMLKVKAEQK
jgi:hypothetical protein